MTPEEKLFAKMTEEIQKKFDSIGDEKVKEAVKSAFDVYSSAYEGKTEQEFSDLKTKMDELNKSFDAFDSDQNKELATQLSKIEETLTSFESKLKEIGKKVTEGSFGSGKKDSKNTFAKSIEEYLLSKIPNEDGVIVFDAMEEMKLSSGLMGDLPESKKSNGQVGVFSTKAMFAALDPMTNANSTAGQAIARDIDTMGFRNIPPILNDHVADIFTTPRMGVKAYMTLRIFHTYEDGSGIKAEGASAFAKSSVQLKSQDYKVFTYGTQYKISVEESEDVPEIVTELNAVIPDRLMNDLDEKILTDGGDNSVAPWGAFSTNATRPNVTIFNPYLYAGSAPDADVADLIAKMKLFARSQNYRVNGVLAHDNFYDNYEGLRDSNKNSLMDRRVQFSPTGEITAMAGLSTRKTRVMNETAVWVGSTPSQIIGIRENVMMQVGLNGTDFEDHNISTKWWGRFAYGVKDALANVYTADFNADIAILAMTAATALSYTDEVAKATAGYDQANITISLLATAGATDLIDANETAYQVAIEAATGVADLPALQVIIDAVNAA